MSTPPAPTPFTSMSGRPTLDEELFLVERHSEHYVVTCLTCGRWQRVVGQRPADRFAAEHMHG